MAKKDKDNKDNIEVVESEETVKGSRFAALKAAILVILALVMVIGISMTVLYFTNKEVRASIESTGKKLGIIKDKEIPEPVDRRVKELGQYYLTMSVEEASEKLFSLKKEDKKFYGKLISAMIGENSVKTGKINDRIKEKEAKTNTLQREYESMAASRDEKIKQDATHYASLGLKGAIDAIEENLLNSMDYENMAKVMENMQPNVAARIMYYINPSYGGEIRKYFSLKSRSLIDKELDKYKEFIRHNSSLSMVYNPMEPKMAAKELEDPQKFSMEQLGLIFSKMDYLNGAGILNKFQNSEYAAEVLEKMKAYEDYESTLVDSISEVTSDSLKVLKKYDEDVDILKRAYEKMPSTDLADIVDKNTGQNQVYKEYKIDEVRSFRISEKDMTIEVLKRSKPTVVSGLLSELKNSDRTAKAAYLSREIGIPQP